MKKQIILGIMSLLFAHFAQAESSRDWYDDFIPDKETPFQESELSLPDLPDTNSGDWFDLYINETHAGTPRILLSSITRAGDNSVRYILNQRSRNGYDNVSAEGLLCVTGYKLLSSEGAKVKTFGYADFANQRWITPRRSDWTAIGGKMNGTDKVRGTLYQLMCVDGLPKTDAELRQRIARNGGRIDRE